MNWREALYRTRLNTIDPMIAVSLVHNFKKSKLNHDSETYMRDCSESNNILDSAIIKDIAQFYGRIRNKGYDVEIAQHRLAISFLSSSHSIPMPTSLRGFRNLLELVYLSSCYGFILLDSESTPLSKYCLVEGDILTLYDNSRFFIETIDPWVIVETFFLEVHKQPLSGETIVIDVGAAFGDTALYYARKGAKVLAIEPVNFDSLVRNLGLNQDIASRITCVNSAIGDGEVRPIYYVPNEFDGNARLDSSPFDRVKRNKASIHTLTIEEIMNSHGIENGDVLKMDCKGCERFLMPNDLQHILKYVEITTSFVKSVVDVLNKSGFNTWSINYNPLDRMSAIEQSTTYGVKKSLAI